MGALLARGMRVQRGRIRALLQRLDPVGRALRRRLKIRRRVYNVPCANFLSYVSYEGFSSDLQFMFKHEVIVQLYFWFHFCINGVI